MNHIILAPFHAHAQCNKPHSLSYTEIAALCNSLTKVGTVKRFYNRQTSELRYDKKFEFHNSVTAAWGIEPTCSRI